MIAECGAQRPARDPAAGATGGLGCDAQWADDFHHALRTLLTGERDGYYAEFGTVADLAKAFHRPFVHDGQYSASASARSARPPRTARPSSSSSSPRTTTRSATAPSATGCRPRPARWPRSARCSRRSRRCCSWARSTASRRRSSSSPTTSTTRSPRRRARAAARVRGLRRLRGEVPDPQDVATFERSKLTRERGPGARDALRATAGAAAASCAGRGRGRRSTSTRTRAGCACAAAAHEIVCNFAAEPRHVPGDRARGRARPRTTARRRWRPRAPAPAGGALLR